jgi:hypothetical protein
MTDTLLRDHELITVVSETEPTLEIPVEVWCAYSQRWVQGFRLHDTLSDGKLVLLGRDSEAVLPAAFDPESVRFADAEQSASLLAWKQSAA